ncbi:MAG: hypothetical protein JWN08_556 [Frankiales bacterium]|nr:hypothetical protein [Frankiales bacterium]
MSPVRRLARPLLASTFVLGGASALRAPAARVELARAAGLSDPEALVRVNAAAMLAGGLALATGRLPRLSSLVLAGTLVPTTVVGHPFWSETDRTGRAAQRTQFAKNLSILGGLLISAADTGGRESIPHAAGRLSRRAARRTQQAAKQAQAHLPG